MSERVQKILARAGFGSRRACEQLLREGRVTVDGVMAELGATADPTVHLIAVDGTRISLEKLEYWVLNKPPGVVSTASDPQGRRTVVDCVPAQGRIFPVGRLDQDTTGVLVLTNDGELTHRLLHPSREVDKEYRVTVAGRMDDGDARRLASGVELEDGMTAPARVRILSQSAHETEVTMVIHEGRKRQIKRMMNELGYTVLALHRTRFDGVSAGDLGLGEARYLRPDELRSLRIAGGLA